MPLQTVPSAREMSGQWVLGPDHYQKVIDDYPAKKLASLREVQQAERAVMAAGSDLKRATQTLDDLERAFAIAVARVDNP